MVDNKSEKEEYKTLCMIRSDIPLFMQYWWMNAVCNYDNWDVILYKKNDDICAAWVYHHVIKYGFKLIVQPQLTQTNGIWIENSYGLKENELLKLEHKAIRFLMDKFNEIKFSYFNQRFHYTFTNWLPFYWDKFEQTTRYTYQIKDISDIEQCYNNFSYAKRKQIKKAEKIISIHTNLSGEEFYNHVESNLLLNNKSVFFTRHQFLTLHNTCVDRHQGCIISASDSKNNLHAALFIVWDNNSAYNLISTIHPSFRSSGASTLVVWEAIKLMSGKTKIFDFEGSMEKDIEKSFRGFGAIQVPYFKITKQNSFIFSLFTKLRAWN